MMDRWSEPANKPKHPDNNTVVELLGKICVLLEDIYAKLGTACVGRKENSLATTEIENTDLTDDLLDAVAVRQLFGITSSTYYRWVQKGILTPSRLNKKDFYRKTDLKDLLEKRRFRERGL